MKDSRPVDYLGYLLQGATMNDSLLQSYRNIHLTMQSIFLAIGTGLFVAVLAFNELAQSISAIAVLVVLTVIAFWAITEIRKIIKKRGEDVNFWHREVITVECSMSPCRRKFTKFKIEQSPKERRGNLEKRFLTDRVIKEDDIYDLVEEGLGHTRKVLDVWLFDGIEVMWVFLLVVSIGYTVCPYLGAMVKAFICVVHTLIPCTH